MSEHKENAIALQRTCGLQAPHWKQARCPQSNEMDVDHLLLPNHHLIVTTTNPRFSGSLMKCDVAVPATDRKVWIISNNSQAPAINLTLTLQ
jgi:hypothetical protein